MRKSWWIVLMLTVACAGGDGGERADGAGTPETTGSAPTSQQQTSGAEPSSSTVSDRGGGSPTAPHPDTPKDVVIALIKAFQAGDQAAVEALWARDGGTWTDAAGFRERAAYYQKAEFDLDPASMKAATRLETTTVIVKARQGGQDYVWSFLVTEIDGRLRAGGVEAHLAGLP